MAKTPTSEAPPEEILDVDKETGEIRDLAPYDAPAPPGLPEVGGLPIFRLDDARQLRAALVQYQQDTLSDDDYVFYVSWLERGRRKRSVFDTRLEAERIAWNTRGAGGRVEPRMRAQAYDKLAMPLNISTEPVRELVTDCRPHDGKHPVHTVYVRVTAANGRYATCRGVQAACEKVTGEDSRILGGRMEHDTPAIAERRGYVRAMKQLLGFGEIAPYMPTAVPAGATNDQGGAQPARASKPTERQPVDASPTPADANQAWSAFWSHARLELEMSQEEVHAFFQVSSDEGALKRFAEDRAVNRSLNLTEVIADMRDSLKSRQGEPPAAS